jgi:hypothetical protein
MSKENVEVAARIYEVWRTSKEEVSANLPRMMDSCHPEVEWSQREEGWTHRGRDGVRGALELWLESFDTGTRCSGSSTVVAMRFGRRRRSGQGSDERGRGPVG